MRFDIITIFPQSFKSYLDSSIIGRAIGTKRIQVAVHDIRQWTHDAHRTVDEKPYGGGPGMVLKIEPIYKAVKEITANRKSKIANQKKFGQRIILLSAKGKLFTQQKARQLSKYGRLVFICGHYEGVDERVAKYVADEELSIGEYVLTGGELGALVVLDAVSRFVPGVLGKQESLAEESFSKPGVREYPHYTRPEVFYPLANPKSQITNRIAQGRKPSRSRRLLTGKAGLPTGKAGILNRKGWRVPKVLLSGNHAAIAKWRQEH